MFENEKKDYFDNKQYLISGLCHDLGLNSADVMPLIVDYLMTSEGYENLVKDIERKVENAKS